MVIWLLVGGLVGDVALVKGGMLSAMLLSLYMAANFKRRVFGISPMRTTRVTTFVGRPSTMRKGYGTRILKVMAATSRFD